MEPFLDEIQYSYLKQAFLGNGKLLTVGGARFKKEEWVLLMNTSS